MARFAFLWIFCLLAPGMALAQGSLQPRWLIESPTAGLLPRGGFSVDVRLYGDNGILTQVDVGVLSRLSVGLSFGGRHLVGSQEAVWNPRVEFAGRVRVVEEKYRVPAVAVGYHSQGYGAYDRDLERYLTKSKGLYAVLSKNYGYRLGNVGFHGGVNRSLEDADGDEDLSGFVGMDLELGSRFAVLMEYDFAVNDNEDNTLGSGRGLFNAGGRWSVTRHVALEVDVKNLFRNGQRNPNPDREVRLMYAADF